MPLELPRAAGWGDRLRRNPIIRRRQLRGRLVNTKNAFSFGLSYASASCLALCGAAESLRKINSAPPRARQVTPRRQAGVWRTAWHLDLEGTDIFHMLLYPRLRRSTLRGRLLQLPCFLPYLFTLAPRLRLQSRDIGEILKRGASERGASERGANVRGRLRRCRRVRMACADVRCSTYYGCRSYSR